MIDMARIEGNGAPTRFTAAEAGDFYIDTETNTRYVLKEIITISPTCVTDDGHKEYRWKKDEKYTTLHEVIAQGKNYAGELYDDVLDTIASDFFRDYGSITSIDLPSVTEIKNDAFYDCTAVVTINLPNVTLVGEDAFLNCDKVTDLCLPKLKKVCSNAFENMYALKQISLPSLEEAEGYLFYDDSALTNVELPLLQIINESMFIGCSALVVLNLPRVNHIRKYAFEGCSVFETLILRSETVVTLEQTNALSDTKIASGTGYIYVPKALINDYKTAENWSTFANQIRAIEDYPEICGTTE